MQADKAQAITDMFSTLLGREVEARPCESTPPDLGSHYYAYYKDEMGGSVTILAFETDMAASLAAAFSMLPCDVDAQKAELLTKDSLIQQSFIEICNISVSLLNHDNKPTMKLQGIKTKLDKDSKAHIESLVKENRCDQFTLDVPSYITGNFMVIE